MSDVAIYIDVQKWTVLDLRRSRQEWRLYCESGAITVVFVLDQDTLRELHDEIERGAEWLIRCPLAVEQWKPKKALPVNGPWSLALTYHPKAFFIQAPRLCLAEDAIGTLEEISPYWEIEARETSDATATLRMAHRDIGALVDRLRRLLLREEAELLTASETPDAVREYATADHVIAPDESFALLDQIAVARRERDASLDPIGTLVHGGVLPMTTDTLLRMDDFRDTELQRKLAPTIEEVEGWGVQRPTPLALDILQNLARTRGAMPVINLQALRTNPDEVLHLLTNVDVANVRAFPSFVPAQDLVDYPEWLLEILERGLAGLLWTGIIAVTSVADDYALRQHHTDHRANPQRPVRFAEDLGADLSPSFGPTEAALFWHDRVRASERPLKELRRYIDRADCGNLVREILAAREERE